jgi:hypothetical protein
MTTINVTTTGYSVNNGTEVTASVPLAAAIREAGKYVDNTTIYIHRSIIT